MITKSTKIDDNTIEIETSQTKTSTARFLYDSLVAQRDAILAQKQRDSAQRDVELAEIDSYIQEAVNLGIKSKSDAGAAIGESNGKSPA